MLVMGSQLRPSSEIQKVSTAFGMGVLPGSVGAAEAAAEVVTGGGAPKARSVPSTLATPSSPIVG